MAASSLKQRSQFLFVFVLAIFFLSHPVNSDDEAEHLLQDLNDFRTSVNLPAFTKNKNAHCVAKKIVDEMDDDDHPCTNPSSSSSGNKGTRLSDYPRAVSKCHIDTNTTSGAVVLPVCVANLVPTLVLTNFTRTHFSRYINDSSFTGIGISSEDDWIVVVLASNTQSGSLASGASSHGLSYYVVFLLLGFVARLNLV
ncbi:NAD(P)-binding Rossmann-fold superfamily protein [Hibiscus syriacus]|uniref:NAD(P)-binding Rossmann-fold superfamily protein n=1 Tax=Hibiscus syriacus TaxID=106335 RepID=A0A6A2Z0M5_HIBSY|nr:uncharacterized GPI-anchored protein At3g06035-like [Hibiscus syriacus]KAE8684999.1 NAD(P)-binding Rossmann-fold superfamily protein [Hibiscus syriacus]